MVRRPDNHIERLLRDLAPQVLGALVRRYGNFDTAEDAVQEALLAAATQWPDEGVPDSPRAWLITVAARRLTDLLRRDQSRREREHAVAQRVLPEDWLAPAADRAVPGSDDSLVLLFLCCHESLTPASQIALTLRAVGGLTTGEIARAFLVPETTMARRISRAKKAIKDSGAAFRMPSDGLAAVLHVLYLIFNEGYATTSGPNLQSAELSGEAIRLTRMVHRMRPDDSEVAGLLALLLLTDARRAARVNRGGELVPMDEQDRDLWDRAAIAEGTELVTTAMQRGPVGQYQIQAAIAALHDEAPTAADTDWPQIAALYGVLASMSDNPMVELNQAVAVAMAVGPVVGLAKLRALEPRLGTHHRFHAVRAHLLEMSGDVAAAKNSYEQAAQLTSSVPRQRYLRARAARLAAVGSSNLSDR